MIYLDKAQKAIVQSSILSATMDFIETTTTHPSHQEKQKEQEGFSLESVKQLLVKVVTSTTMSDGNMRYLIEAQTIISRLISWTTVYGLGEVLDDEIRMSGALCLGNIGRSGMFFSPLVLIYDGNCLDETCVKLVKIYHCEDALLKMVEVEYRRLKESQIIKEEAMVHIKVIHAVLGALKNLSLAIDTRPILGEKNVIESIVRLFEIEHFHSLFISIVGIIKNLCTGSVEGIDGNIYRVLTCQSPLPDAKTLNQMPIPHHLEPGSSYLSSIIKIIWNTSRESEGAGVRNEGGRLLVQIVKSIHRSSGMSKFIFRFTILKNQ